MGRLVVDSDDNWQIQELENVFLDKMMCWGKYSWDSDGWQKVRGYAWWHSTTMRMIMEGIRPPGLDYSKGGNKSVIRAEFMRVIKEELAPRWAREQWRRGND